MESNHKTIVILRCKLVIVGKLLCVCKSLFHLAALHRYSPLKLFSIVVLLGDACVGKTALNQSFVSGGTTYPKNYLMVMTLMNDDRSIYRLTLNQLTRSIINYYNFRP